MLGCNTSRVVGCIHLTIWSGNSLLLKVLQVWTAKLLHPLFVHHSLRGDPLRIIPHEHVCEMCSIMYTFLARLIERFHRCTEIGLVKVRVRKAFAGVQAHLVRC